MGRVTTTSEAERLLDAARALLDRHGLDGLRVDDLLAEAGLSTRAFYRHFSGKGALFLALFDEETRRAAERLWARVDGAPDAPAKVTAWVEGVLALAYDGRLARRTRTFSADRAQLARDFPSEVDQCVRAQRAPLEAAIAGGAADGAFVAVDAAAAARAIHHLCAGLMADKLWGTDPLSRADAIALATRFARGGLGA